MGDEPERPPMPDALRSMAEAAIVRHTRRRAPPETVTKPEQRYYENLTCPYREDDEELWMALLLECFGTRVHAVAQHFFRQLEALVPLVFYEGEDRDRRDEEALRTALAIVYSLKPRNEAEAALAAQYVALHFAAMKSAAYALRYTNIDTRSAASLAALAKAAASHFALLRGGPKNRAIKQTIRVERVYIDNREQHVHAGREGGRESGGQAHAERGERARARPLLPSPDEGGDIMSLSPGEGPEPMPPARGRERIRSAKG